MSQRRPPARKPRGKQSLVNSAPSSTSSRITPTSSDGKKEVLPLSVSSHETYNSNMDNDDLEEMEQETEMLEEPNPRLRTTKITIGSEEFPELIRKSKMLLKPELLDIDRRQSDTSDLLVLDHEVWIFFFCQFLTVRL